MRRLADRDPGVFELDLVTGPPYEMRSSLLGEFTLDIGNDGSVALVAATVPADGIASMAFDGSLNPSSFSGTYTIEFEGGGGAEGTIEATKE